MPQTAKSTGVTELSPLLIKVYHPCLARECSLVVCKPQFAIIQAVAIKFIRRARQLVHVSCTRAMTISSMGSSWMTDRVFPENQAGALVVVDSKQYLLGERLGHGAGGA
eukprot:5255195-Amphidinium_carterae.1